MKTYLDIVRKILEDGEYKENRTGTRALTCPNIIFSHNMSKGWFPLLTTKKMAFRSMCVELEGFIGGVTSKKWYKDRKCNFWSNWANPKKVHKKCQQELVNFDNFYPKTRKQIQFEEDDLGTFYAHQLRRFNQTYSENDEGCLKQYDQLQYIVDLLKTDPNSRRMIVVYWNPCQIDQAALPPCHDSWRLTHINGVCNMGFVMRSTDTQLGLPVNIAHYALLLSLLCKEADLIPGNLSGFLTDCHIYENHIEGAKEQLEREPKFLPQIKLTHNGSIFDWTHNDIELLNYDPHPKIKFPIAI